MSRGDRGDSGGRDRCRGQRGSVLHWVGVLSLVLVLSVAAIVYLGDPLAIEGTPPDVPPPTAESAPVVVLDEAPSPPDVLAGLASSTSISDRELRTRLNQLVSSSKLGRHLGFAVAELGDDRPLWRTRGADSVMPASTTKLLTCVSVLQQLGPEHRFETVVVSGRTPRDIVLVGGGDPLLTDETPSRDEAATLYPRPATLQALAAQTAAALKTAGRTKVTLTYDDSLFTGPAVSPQWEPDYVRDSVVSPITALWVDEGRAVGGLAQRVRDPSSEAAGRFAALLARRGVTVRGAVTPGRAAPGAGELASVLSAPLAQIVQHVLEVSDNEGAEVLARQAALAAGRPASFIGGAETARRTLEELGIGTADIVLVDGSGLSRQNLMPIQTLIDVLQVAAKPSNPDLRTVISTLPVAGFSGSLDYRFVSDAPAGLGVVRAKTGTLTGVHGLAGVAVTRAGQALVFAAVADDVPVRKTLAARAQLDRIAAGLATCGC